MSEPLSFSDWHEKKRPVLLCGCSHLNDTTILCVSSPCLHAYAEYRVREANRWRKWPEEKPENDGEYYICALIWPDGCVGVSEVFYPNHTDCVWDLIDYAEGATVIAWQPLPEYNEE